MSLFSSNRHLKLKNISLAVGSTDFIIPVPSLGGGTPSFIVRKVTAVMRGGAPGIATVGIFTAAAAGGVSVVALALLSGVANADGKWSDLTIAGTATTDVLTSNSLFLRVGAAGANSVDISIIIDDIS